MVTEADKGRPTCIIKEKKVNELIETDFDNQNTYHSLKKKDKFIKNFKKLKGSELIIENTFKDLEPHTPKTPSARPLLEIYKNPLKIRLRINTENSAICKTGKPLSKELQQITATEKNLSKIQKV